MVRGGHESLGSGFTDCLGCCECVTVSAGVMYRGVVRAFTFTVCPRALPSFMTTVGGQVRWVMFHVV